jgi:hypothetical protein
MQMVYRGTVKSGGVIELDAGTALPEGTRVNIQPVSSHVTQNADGEDSLFRMSDLAVDTGIPDLATNIDHYLYGHPKVDEDE